MLQYGNLVVTIFYLYLYLLFIYSYELQHRLNPFYTGGSVKVNNSLRIGNYSFPSLDSFKWLTSGEHVP